MFFDDAVKHSGNTSTCQRGIHFNGKALPAVKIDDVEHSNRSSSGQLVTHKIHGPDFIQSRNRRQRVAPPFGRFTFLSFRKLQSQIAIHTVDPFMVIQPALHAESVINRPISPPAVLLRLLLERSRKFGVIPAFGSVVIASRCQLNQPAASAQADLIRLPQEVGRLALLSGLYQFFELISFSIWLSRLRSAIAHL